jgi:hypothetical protein
VTGGGITFIAPLLVWSIAAWSVIMLITDRAEGGDDRPMTNKGRNKQCER